MITVWVDNGSERGNHGHHPDFIDLTIANVGEWLVTISACVASAPLNSFLNTDLKLWVQMRLGLLDA